MVGKRTEPTQQYYQTTPRVNEGVQYAPTFRPAPGNQMEFYINSQSQSSGVNGDVTSMRTIISTPQGEIDVLKHSWYYKDAGGVTTKMETGKVTTHSSDPVFSGYSPVSPNTLKLTPQIYYRVPK